MKDFSYITSSHPQFIESLYQEFVSNPDSIDPEMRKFFEGFDFAISAGKVSSNGGSVATASLPADVDWMREVRAYRMILGYRNKGHLIAKTNPIRKRKDRGANIGLDFYGFTEADMNQTFQAGTLVGLGPTTLRKIHEHLEKCYASHNATYRIRSGAEAFNRSQAERPRPTGPPRRLRLPLRIATPSRAGNRTHRCGRRSQPAAGQDVTSAKLQSTRCGHCSAAPTTRSNRARATARH